MEVVAGRYHMTVSALWEGRSRCSVGPKAWYKNCCGRCEQSGVRRCQVGLRRCRHLRTVASLALFLKRY